MGSRAAGTHPLLASNIQRTYMTRLLGQTLGTLYPSPLCNASQRDIFAVADVRSAIMEGSQIVLPGGLTINLHSFYTCLTKGVVYLILCAGGSPYVGSMRHQVKTRILEHRSRIRLRVEDAPLL